mmetsp:Transcript_13388/g.37978  ORF Transcript_13388/g.37978 Transcript_13388/m.37978 type:complete len:586 (+) Transcript_13388:329-2086(+)
MALNPFAKEFVPTVSSRPTSGLKITTKSEDETAGTLKEAVEGRRSRLHGALPRPTQQPPTASAQITEKSDDVKPEVSGGAGPQGELEFDELFRSPSDRTNSNSLASGDESNRGKGLRDEVQRHQELHNVVPPNVLGSPSLIGLNSEKEILETVDDFINSAEDIQDIKDAISVPEAEIQTSDLDVVPRQAGAIAAGEDPDDVEAEVIHAQSLGRQASCFPDGLQQAEDEATSTSRKLCPQDFEMLAVLGQGAFGKVFLVSKRDTGEIFAMKVMRKDRILEKDHGDYVTAEREVLTAVVHPYIVTLQYSFQTTSKLYLLLDFINGGHLFFQLYREGIFSEDLARLYTAEIVLGISHLHKCGFVHRDLKPENILLDSDGHVKITDFGLSKKNIDDETRTNSYIGTMEYMAPEIVNGTGHGKSVDWWSVGILLYEMLTGMPPFRAKSQQAIKKQITVGKIKFPSWLSSGSLSILKGFLTRDAKKRLGYGPHGSQSVMSHPFFKGINWEKLMKREIPSPFRPAVKSNQSIENFDKIWTDLPPEDSPCATPDHPGLLDAFKNFSYYGREMIMHHQPDSPAAPEGEIASPHP